MVVKVTLTVKGLSNGNFFNIYHDVIDEEHKLSNPDPVSYESIKEPAYVLYENVPDDAVTIIIVDAGFGSGIPAICDTNVEGQGKITIAIDKSLCL